MDACYGGLAITRAPSVGSRRFLKDMCQRYSRQVNTAGKADKTVSNAVGPLPNHFIFTEKPLEEIKLDSEEDEDLLIEVSSTITDTSSEGGFVEKVKSYIPDSSKKSCS